MMGSFEGVSSGFDLKLNCRSSTKRMKLEVESDRGLPLMVPLNPRRPTNSLITLYECQLCTEIIAPPIYQCSAGHLICDPCLRHKRVCKKCNDVFAHPIRALGMEKMAEHFLFPCRYESDGCPESLVLTTRNVHAEYECAVKPYTCDMKGCSFWKGAVEDLKEHVINVHGAKELIGIPVVCPWEPLILLPGDFRFGCEITVLTAFGVYFLLHTFYDYEKRSCGAFVSLIGTRSKACRFQYTLSLQRGTAGEPERVLTYTGPCRSAHDSFRSVYDSGDLLIIPGSTYQVVTLPKDDVRICWVVDIKPIVKPDPENESNMLEA